MAYSEVLNEIQEQIDEVQASIDTYQVTISDATAKVENLQVQLTGLSELKASAEQLIADKDKIDLNISLNVTTDANSEASVIRHTGSTAV